MRKTVLGLVVGLFGLTPAFAPTFASSETLTDALIAAYRASNLLDQNQAVLRAADEDVATAVAALRPVLSYSLNASLSDGYNPNPSFFSPQIGSSFSDSLTLTANMTLFDFGAGDLGVEGTKEIVLATQQSLINVEQQVLFNAVTAYVNMQLQSEIVAMQDSNVRLVSQDLRATQDRFDVGEVTRTDVALAQAQVASASAQLAASQGDYNVAREQFKVAIGHYPGKLAPLPKVPLKVKNLDEARAIAQRTHPAILQAQHQARAADFQVLGAQAVMMPRISGSAQLVQNGTQTGLGTSRAALGISLDQTLYAGGRLSSQYRKALAGKDQARAALHQNGLIIASNVGQAWSNILVANASIQAGDEQVRAAQAAYDGVKEEADLGSRTTLDVLDAEQKLLSARASRLQAAANLYNGQYQLLATMGLLTAEHLHLGIPTYDVSAYYNAVKNAPTSSPQGEKLDRILKTIGN